MRVLPLLALTLPGLAATGAAASTDEAWAEFRTAVAAACTALVTEPGALTVEINPFGSESYGAALVTLATPAGTDRMVCIYDKRAKTAELTAPFGG